MGNNSRGSLGGILVVVILIILLLRGGGGGGSLFGALFRLFGLAVKAVLIIGVFALIVTAVVIYFSEKDKKKRGKRDAPNVTPRGEGGPLKDASGSTFTESRGQAAPQDASPEESAPKGASSFRVADRSKTYEKTPEGVRQMLSDYRIDCVLGPVSQDALAQKDRLEKQLESYRRLVERRFGKGTLSAEKYLAVEKSTNDALQNSFLRLANRMEAFDTTEYLSFSTGAYREDAIPDHVQEQRHTLYDENLDFMKNVLAENEYVLACMDKLMLKLADSDAAEADTYAEIQTLEQQLDYYRKNLKE